MPLPPLASLFPWERHPDAASRRPEVAATGVTGSMVLGALATRLSIYNARPTAQKQLPWSTTGSQQHGTWVCRRGTSD